MSSKQTALILSSCILLFSGTRAATELDLNGGTWRAVNPPGVLKALDGRDPPLLPDAKLIYERNKAAAKAGNHQFDTTSRCLPPGMPRLLYVPGSFEFLQRPEQIVILYEWNRLIRVVDMNVPQPELIGPSYLGQSVGSWDGKTLRIETIGLVDSTVLDSAGLPHSDELRLTEEYVPVSKEKMHVIMTVDDPKTYASPWQAKLTLTHDPRGRIREDVCLERSAAAQITGQVK